MSAVQAVNIGYTPKHAAPPPPRRRQAGPKRWRILVLIVCCGALAASGIGYLALRSDRQPVRAASRSQAGQVDVVIDSTAAYGLHKPGPITVRHGHVWVADAARDSVTEFSLRAGRQPVTWSGHAYRFVAPTAMTASRDDLWIANAHSLTEMSAITGKPVRIISGYRWMDNLSALVLFGRRLWISNATSVAEISTRTGNLIRLFHSRKYGFASPAALAISHHRLWVANSANGSVTEMDAVTGTWIATIRAKRYGLADPRAETAGKTKLWIASKTGGTVTELDTVTGDLVRVISGAKYGLAAPAAMTLADGRIWVANTAGNSVTEIGMSTGALIGRLSGKRFGFDHPASVTSYQGRIWVANRDAGRITELIPQPWRLTDAS